MPVSTRSTAAAAAAHKVVAKRSSSGAAMQESVAASSAAPVESSSISTASSSASPADSDTDLSLVEQMCHFLSEDDEGKGTTAQPPPRSAAISPRSAVSWSLLVLLFLFALLLRYGVGGFGYSGQADPPRFGDFEAQRHWMEITVNLPPSQWYVNGTDNDLQYWGLDYPPLSAYASWVFGKLAQVVGEGELVALHSSRGYESDSSKTFMRLTVLVSDTLLCMIPTAALLRAIHPRAPAWRHGVLTLLAWIAPAPLLIDHGHFQYNSVALGLLVLAVYFMWRGREWSASAAFVASMCFKHMNLYYAPAFFAYLLGRSRMGKHGAPVPLSKLSDQQTKGTRGCCCSANCHARCVASH